MELLSSGGPMDAVVELFEILGKNPYVLTNLTVRAFPW